MKTEYWLNLGEIGEQEVEITFDYQPDMYSTLSEPGFSAGVQIYAIKWNGIDIKDSLKESKLFYIQQDLMEDCNDYADY